MAGNAAFFYSSSALLDDSLEHGSAAVYLGDGSLLSTSYTLAQDQTPTKKYLSSRTRLRHSNLAPFPGTVSLRDSLTGPCDISTAITHGLRGHANTPPFTVPFHVSDVLSPFSALRGPLP
ncbi:hypothetical protein DFH09DRAFT_1315061 [Mycena vulgaris]|nr:hypothetical protein DFH09DRAFT_1315061 [Mycena vulgaris]